MKLVRRSLDTIAGERTVLRSPAHTLAAPVQLTYRVALSRSARDPLAAIDIYVVHRAHAHQTRLMAHAWRVRRWQRSALGDDWTVCVPNGTYWLEFHATVGWLTAVYEVNRIHGGDEWAVPCTPPADRLADGEYRGGRTGMQAYII